MKILKGNGSSVWFFLLMLILELTIVSKSACGSKQDISEGVIYSKDSIAAVARKYFPDYSILQLENLSEDLQKYFTLTYGNAQPGRVQDDFDGDGFTDYALLLLLKTTGKAKPLEKLIVLLGNGKGTFIPIDLYEIENGVSSPSIVKNCYIVRCPPGEVEEWDHSSKVAIKYAGIEWINWESSSCVYYWQNGEFHNIWTSD